MKKYKVVQDSEVYTETDSLEIAHEILKIPALGSAVIIYTKQAIKEINDANKD